MYGVSQVGKFVAKIRNVKMDILMCTFDMQHMFTIGMQSVCLNVPAKFV
jgi:hypothetical protein